MGGGDLNLKKSWHPQTLRNVEKVWMAEQKAEAESQKIEQLQRELNEEREREEMQKYAVDQGITKKKSDRLEWMYSAPGHSGINHEDYLLGKSIDKAVDPMAVNDEKSAEAPGASFIEDTPNTTTDLANKIRDDPLFMIKKKETEKKKELLKNPVRMKQLQEMLKADLGKKGQKKSKKEKKKRKKEKKNKYSSDEDKTRNRKLPHKRRKSNSQSNSDSDRDKALSDKHKNTHAERNTEIYSQKYRNGDDGGDKRDRSSRSPKRETIKKHSRKNSESGSGESSSSPRKKTSSDRDYSNRSDKHVSKASRYNAHSRSRSRSPRNSRKANDIDNYSSKTRYNTSNNSRNNRTRSFSRSPSPRKNRSENLSRTDSNERGHKFRTKSRSKKGRSSSPSNSPERKQNVTVGKNKYKSDREISPKRQKRSRSRSPQPRYSSKENASSETSRKVKKESGVTRKMTQEERDRKLAEMMDNAKWRDEQRGQNVKRYKKEDEDEASAMAKHNEKGASFVRPMQVDTFTSSNASVENRIKRNINSLQRTPAAMENFLKK